MGLKGPFLQQGANSQGHLVLWRAFRGDQNPLSSCPGLVQAQNLPLLAEPPSARRCPCPNDGRQGSVPLPVGFPPSPFLRLFFRVNFSSQHARVCARALLSLAVTLGEFIGVCFHIYKMGDGGNEMRA